MTTDTSTRLTVELASVPDRDDLVAEVWFGPELLAELRRERGGVRVQLYNEPGGGSWDLPYEDLLAALQHARMKLGLSASESPQTGEPA